MNLARRNAHFNSHLCESAVIPFLQPLSSRDNNCKPLQQPPPQPAATLDSLLSILSSHPTPYQFDQTHALFITSGLFRSNFAANHLLRSSTFLDAHMTLLIFSQLQNPNLFSYNIAIKSMSDTSDPLQSLPLYITLLISGLHPNEYTFCFLLDCCAISLASHEGRQLHAQLFKHGFNLTVYSSTSLVHMYGRCASLHDAHQVFGEMPQRSNVSWGAMINAFLSRKFIQGLKLLPIVCRLGFRLSNATLVSILCHCAEQGELDIARVVHGYTVVTGMELNLTLGTSLINIYSKCGAILTAMKIFDAMPAKNVASWNCMIRGMAINGLGAKAVELFEGMKVDNKVRPNGLTFLGVLQACIHSGLIEEGIQHFIQMIRVFGIKPSLKHYGCIVDLYGKAGRVLEAMEVIRTMHLRPDNVIWMSLFSGFKTHGYDEELGELIAANAIKLCADGSCGYLLLSHAYASSRRWDDVVGVRRMMEKIEMKKVPGFSSIPAATA